MKRFLTYLIVLAILLSFAACDSGGSISDRMDKAEYSTLATENLDALSAFRGNMKPPIIAVADFGFPELSEEFGIMDYLLDEYPKWMENHIFISNIPEERIIRTCDYGDWSNLLCIVPRDPISTVCVNIIRYQDVPPYEETEVAYRSESGEPILLLANTSDDVLVSVLVTDKDGRGVSFIPYWGTAIPVPDEGFYGALMMDFTPESEKTPYEQAISQGWRLPELVELTDSFWLSFNGYSLELSDNAVPDDNGGWAAIYDVGEIGEYTQSYAGSWQYENGLLHLSLVPEFEDGYLVDDSFPVLMLDGGLWIGRNEYGNALPHFYDDQTADILEQPKG